METTKEMLSRNTLLSAYGSNYFLSVCPAFGIDKVRFSVVKNGTKGKDSADIYLTLKEFWLFCNEIDSGIAEKKIAADTGAYPTAYQWAKGENGSKKLTIGGGQKGIRVQTQIFDGKKADRRMTVVQMDDLKWMSYLFKLVLGQIPYAPGSILEDWTKTLKSASSKFVQNYDEKKDGTPVDTPSEKKNNDDEVQEFHLLTCSEITQKDKFLAVECEIKELGQKCLVLFDDAAQKQKFFPILAEAVKTYSKSGVKLHIKGILKGKFILFKENCKN